jgi:hypothetical protein
MPAQERVFDRLQGAFLSESDKDKLRLEQQRRKRAKKSTTEGKYAIFKRTYRDHFDLFLQECVTYPPGTAATDYQLEMAEALIDHNRISVRGPRGLGKTAFLALCAHWFALTRDGEPGNWKIVTTASTHRHLTEFLWPEIHIWADRLKWDVIGRRPYSQITELMRRSLHLKTGHALSIASNKPEKTEGAHAPHMMYIFDESKSIPAAMFDSAEGAMFGASKEKGREAFALAFSTPGEPYGRFYEIHQRKPAYHNWWVRHVTWTETVAAGLNTPEDAEQMAKQWGTGSQSYFNHVLGEFKQSDEHGLVPLAWVEAANERWIAIISKIAETYGVLPDSGCQSNTERWESVCTKVCNLIEENQMIPFSRLGVDVADGGGDESVIAPRFGNMITRFRATRVTDPMQVAGTAYGMWQRFMQDAPVSRQIAIVDTIGVGAGTVRRLRELGVKVFAFNAQGKGHGRDASGEMTFRNQRSQAFWHLRELLDPESGFDIALPPDDNMIADLTVPQFRTLSGGQILVESKDDIRRRMHQHEENGRSTDRGDAVAYAFFNLPPVIEDEEYEIDQSGSDIPQTIASPYGQRNQYDQRTGSPASLRGLQSVEW